MAKVIRFRVGSAVTDTLAVGSKEYSAGQEFTLPSDQVKKFIDSEMIDKGYLIPVEEVGLGAAQVWDQTAQGMVEGKSGQTLDRFGELLDLETRPVGLQVVLAADDVSDQTDEARFYPDEDCYFESVQFVDVTTSNLGSQNYRLQVKNIPNGTDTASAVDLLEYAGTSNNRAEHVAVGASGATPTDATTAANGPNASGTVDFGLAASNAEWVYLGFYDKFDGMYVDVDNVNAESATATVEYSQVTDSGTIQWTTLQSFTDNTVSGDVSLAQDGSITWDRPGDWGKTTIGSESSGSANLYYVRVGDVTDTAFTTDADANELWLLSRKMRTKNSNVYIEKGDMLRFDSPLAATGAHSGSNYTGAVDIVLGLRKAR